MNAHKKRSPRGSGFVRPEGDSKLYQAGDPVPTTGVYEIIHHGQHRRAHEVVLISGDRFPGREGCGEGLRFRHVKTAPYIFQDEDFVRAA